jgi:phosphoribosylglycinamide formyltransferase-1
MVLNIAILGSTNGTDAEFILHSIKENILTGVNVKCIISNKSKAGILDKASKYNTGYWFISARNGEGGIMSREEYDMSVDEMLKPYDIDYIVLVGWMRILSSQFVKKWENKILNIHPSLLPAYEGQMDLNVHRAVLDRGCKITGATLMFVDEGADTGPIIGQKSVQVENNDTPESLKEKVQQLEKELFLEYLPLLRDGKLCVKENKVIIAE